jgi:hypothetical protein
MSSGIIILKLKFQWNMCGSTAEIGILQPFGESNNNFANLRTLFAATVWEANFHPRRGGPKSFEHEGPTRRSVQFQDCSISQNLLCIVMLNTSYLILS